MFSDDPTPRFFPPGTSGTNKGVFKLGFRGSRHRFSLPSVHPQTRNLTHVQGIILVACCRLRFKEGLEIGINTRVHPPTSNIFAFVIGGNNFKVVFSFSKIWTQFRSCLQFGFYDTTTPQSTCEIIHTPKILFQKGTSSACLIIFSFPN